MKMGKEILTFGGIEIEKKNKFYHHKTPIYWGDVDIEKDQHLTRFLLMKKTINTLLVTCTIIIKLSYYI